MAASGTYGTGWEVAELCDEVAERCGLDPADLTARHVKSFRRSLDLMFVEWANHGVMLWAVEEISLPLVDGTATYTLNARTIGILDAYIRRSGVDTVVDPMSRDEYAMIPDKTQEGLPSQYYLNRATTPTLSLWLVPENSTDTFRYYAMRQLQEVGAASNTPDIAHRWYEALVSGWAAKVAVKYAPDRIGPLKGEARSQLNLARQEDRQRTPTRIRARY